MDEKLEQLIIDYVNLKVKDPEERKKVVIDIIAFYESGQIFTPYDDGEFEMLTGNTPDEVSDFLKNDPWVKKIINEANNKFQDIDRK